MRVQIMLNSGDAQAARAIHKAVQSRNLGTKLAGHRFERRKVREYLRRSDTVVEELLDLAEY
jgi:hypothetical protein